MEGFDAISMTFPLAGPISLHHVTGLDTLDQRSNFDAETFAG